LDARLSWSINLVIGGITVKGPSLIDLAKSEDEKLQPIVNTPLNIVLLTASGDTYAKPATMSV
jgi:hypothetical protein